MTPDPLDPMKPKAMNRYWLAILVVVLVASVVLSLVGTPYKGSHIWDIAVFFAFYGFVGCVVIIYASKALGKLWLQRPEDYYAPYGAPTEVGAALEQGGESRPGGGREPGETNGRDGGDDDA